MNRLARLLAFGAGLGVLAVAPALAGETTAPSGKNVPPSLMLQNEREAVPAQDYPSSSYRSGEEGTSSFKVWADANGKLLDCQITKSSGVKALDDQTCASLRLRGKFTASGAPNETDGRYSMTDSVQWVIPASVPRPLFLGVTLTDSQPTKDDRIRCAFSDGVVRFVAKAASCVLDVPRQASVDGGAPQSIVDRYEQLYNSDPKPEYAFNAALILATQQYGQAVDYLNKASDKGLGLASFVMCGLHATPNNLLMNVYDPKEAVRRCLLAHQQGFDLGLVLIRQFLATHPDAATSDERQFINSYQPSLPIATTDAGLTVAGNALIRPQDYPKEEVKRKVQGRTIALFRITPQGRVQECLIIQSSLSYPLDETVCRRMREAAIYTPATLLGQPTEVWKTQAVSWQVDRNDSVLGGTLIGALLGAIIGHAM